MTAVRHALVFGGSGQIGASLLPRLRESGWQVTAVSRGAQADAPGLRWLRGDLASCGALPASVDAIFSCGPLDHFADWYARAEVAAPRVLVFGSTSAAVKGDSVDSHERDIARRLQEGERKVHEIAKAHAASATVLRPTLVYGAGRDRTLSRIASLASRLGWLPVPRGADGLRQPVHVDDLAVAALAACDAPAAPGNGYDVPGGETLPWCEMVARVLASLDPPPRMVPLPAPLFAVLVRGARLLGKGEGFGDAAMARLREDLVFDPGRARRDFGYAPRGFEP